MCVSVCECVYVSVCGGVCEWMRSVCVYSFFSLLLILPFSLPSLFLYFF